MSVRRRLVNTAFGGGQGSPWLRALPADRTLFRVGGGSKTRDNRRNEVERLARALPGLGSEFFAATWLACEGVSRSISTQAAIQPHPHGETPTGGAGARNERTRRTTAAHGAAHLGGTRHGGGMRGREERPDAQPATVQGRGCSWRVAFTDDFRATLQQTRLALEERGEDGAPNNSGFSRTHAGAAPPQPRGHSPPWSEAQGFAAAADALARQRELPTGGYGTPKGAAGLARHMPGRAKNEPGRADDVTGQPSDCR